MLAAMLSGLMMASNFILRGGNNMWIPENVRPLGCYSPFHLYSFTGAYTESADVVGFTSCFMCTTNFVVLRGSQCVCIETFDPRMIAVDETYCDILCDDQSQSDDALLMCGGNLGGSLYCNKMAGADCLDAMSNETITDIYRHFGMDGKEDFQLMEPCLQFGCGKPDYTDSSIIYTIDYFPNLNPEDCVIYCTLMKTSYAHVGWVNHQIKDEKELFPTCACSNSTLPADPLGPPCSNGTCPTPLNPLTPAPVTGEQSCGNKDKEHSNWNVYCTTTIVDGICAPYQNPSTLDGDWDTCPPLLTSTQRMIPSLLTTLPHSNKNLCSSPSKDDCQCHRDTFKFLKDALQFNCEDNGIGHCHFNGSYYYMDSNTTNDMTDVDTFRNYAEEFCAKTNGGHLLAIETKEEYDFIRGVINDYSNNPGDKTCFLTSGLIRYGCDSVWSFPGEDEIAIDADIIKWGIKCSSCEELSENETFYLQLSIIEQSSIITEDLWEFTRPINGRFICEYKIEQEVTMSQTTSPSETTTPIAADRCTCTETDVYHVKWTIPANTTLVQSCRPGADGIASWACDSDPLNALRCKVRTKQPNFSACQSQELEDIASRLEEAAGDSDLWAVWESLRNFTSTNDTYFGHEIDSILELITQLLDRQDGQMNDTLNHLEFQINTTVTGVRIFDNLVSHDIQWDQLDQDNRSQTALLLLDVSENMAFRLADVAEQGDQPLRCEIGLTNITLSSSYWNQSQSVVYDCNLTVITSASSQTFRRFPMSSSDSTYILLPEEAISSDRLHKAAGVLISHHIMQQLLPGNHSVLKDKNKDKKQVNSPLVSYSLSHQIPPGAFVQLVFQHGETAKDPPVRILHRELKPGETPSAVIDSTICAFLSYNQSDYAWEWDGNGCELESTNRTHSICRCDHLTGFSALMDFHEYAGESPALEITSFVCSFASAISLAITFIVLTILRSIKSDRTFITQNLCFFLFCCHIMVLTTLDRNTLKIDDDVTCAALGVSLHFCLLVSFMWMGIEGLRLCRMVIYVFNLSDWTVYYALAAYTVPFIIVVTTILTAYLTDTGIISAYTGDETCWLNGTNYKWSFAGPIAVIIFANMIFAVIAVRSSWNLRQNTDRSFEEKIRNAATLLLSLTCLLGISWLTGFFLYAEPLIFSYIFTITNGLQGVMIMLFRCILNDEVRTAVKERWRRHKNSRMGKWSSTMTTRSNTNSQQRKSLASNKGTTNLKLGQTLSALSNVTKNTDTTFVSHRYPGQRNRNNLRTFSGTEVSDDFSSQSRESFSTSSSQSSYRPDVKTGNGAPRQVSFFFNADREPTPTTISSSQEDPNDSVENAVSRRIGNLMFYEQDSSVFY